MGNAETKARIEAAFALELASDQLLIGLTHIVGREAVEMCWKLGYVKGASDAYQSANDYANDAIKRDQVTPAWERDPNYDRTPGMPR